MEGTPSSSSDEILMNPPRPLTHFEVSAATWEEAIRNNMHPDLHPAAELIYEHNRYADLTKDERYLVRSSTYWSTHDYGQVLKECQEAGAARTEQARIAAERQASSQEPIQQNAPPERPEHEHHQLSDIKECDEAEAELVEQARLAAQNQASSQEPIQQNIPPISLEHYHEQLEQLSNTMDEAKAELLGQAVRLLGKLQARSQKPIQQHTSSKRRPKYDHEQFFFNIKDCDETESELNEQGERLLAKLQTSSHESTQQNIPPKSPEQYHEQLSNGFDEAEAELAKQAEQAARLLTKLRARRQEPNQQNPPPRLPPLLEQNSSSVFSVSGRDALNKLAQIVQMKPSFNVKVTSLVGEDLPFPDHEVVLYHQWKAPFRCRDHHLQVCPMCAIAPPATGLIGPTEAIVESDTDMSKYLDGTKTLPIVPIDALSSNQSEEATCIEHSEAARFVPQYDIELNGFAYLRHSNLEWGDHVKPDTPDTFKHFNCTDCGLTWLVSRRGLGTTHPSHHASHNEPQVISYDNMLSDTGTTRSILVQVAFGNNLIEGYIGAIYFGKGSKYNYLTVFNPETYVSYTGKRFKDSRYETFDDNCSPIAAVHTALQQVYHKVVPNHQERIDEVGGKNSAHAKRKAKRMRVIIMTDSAYLVRLMCEEVLTKWLPKHLPDEVEPTEGSISEKKKKKKKRGKRKKSKGKKKMEEADEAKEDEAVEEEAGSETMDDEMEPQRKDVKGKAKVEPEAEVKPEADVKGKAKVEPKAEVKPKTELKPETEGKSKVEGKPETVKIDVFMDNNGLIVKNNCLVRGIVHLTFGLAQLGVKVVYYHVPSEYVKDASGIVERDINRELARIQQDEIDD